MSLLFAFFREHAGPRLWLVLGLIVFSSFLEGIGVAAILPILSIAIGGAKGDAGQTGKIAEFLAHVGIPFELAPLLILLVVAISVKSVVRFIALVETADISGQVGRDLRIRLMRALAEARWQYFVTQPMGHLVNTISIEADRSAAGINAFINLLSTVLLVSFYLALAIWISWKVTVVVVVAGLMFGTVARWLIGKAKLAASHGRRALERLTGDLSDVLINLKSLKAMAVLDYIFGLERNAQRVRAANRQQAVANMALKQLFEPFVAILLASGLYAAIRWSEFSLAELIFTAALFQRTMTYVGTLNASIQAIARLQPFIQNVRHMISEAEERREEWPGARRVDFKHLIRLENVCFSYTGQPILANVTIDVRAGALTTFLGPSGSGKTTCVDLICGLHRPDSGRILIDGVDLQEMALEYWRRQIGYVPQEPVLFNASIAENVAMGWEALDREAVEEALGLADALEFVRAMPNGMNSMVGERGQALSGGQRQRIAIARAVYRRPKLLILDEATSALDPDTERAICTTLKALREKVTILVISHGAAFAKISDHVERFRPLELAVSARVVGGRG